MFRRLGFVWTWPGRRGVAEEAQRGGAFGAELEPPAGGDGQGVAGAHEDRIDGFGFMARKASPHLALALQDVPDLLHRLVPHWAGDLSCGQSNFAQAGFGGCVPAIDQEPYLGAVGSGGVGLMRPLGQRRDGW